MEVNELIKKVRRIELKTKGLTSQLFAGQYHSNFKGQGMSFSKVREYQYGDDIRHIDWNVTARSQHPFIKVFEEERELTVMLLIDVSKSTLYGTHGAIKKDVIAEIAAIIGFSALSNQDKVGAILFSDEVELVIPPKKGKSNVLGIIRALVNKESFTSKTDLKPVLNYVLNVQRKRTVCFLISDFMTSLDVERELKLVAQKHDLIALRIYDPAEKKLLQLGVMPIIDIETGQQRWIDSLDEKTLEHWTLRWQQKEKELTNLLLKCSIDHTLLDTSEDYIKPMINLFNRR